MVRPARRPHVVRATAWALVGLSAWLALVHRAPAAAARNPTEDGALRWLAGGYVDYAPSGVPDFSQCRPEWGQPGSPGQWTYAGPVALSDALWWLDSMAEPAPQPPPAPHDGFPLVTSYPVFGPAVDDHDVATLVALSEDLAQRAGTDGRGGLEVVRGTRWERLVAAAEGYVAARRLTARYAVRSTNVPTTAWLAERLAESAGTILQLGVWEHQGDAWRRVGGHYAAVAGANTSGTIVALSDPLADAAGLGGAGRALPAEPTQHSCRTAPRVHDDAAAVSHDQYALAANPGLPHERLVLQGYFVATNAHEVAAFAGQNPAQNTAKDSATWQHGEVVMAVDGALAISPLGVPTAVVPTSEPTATSLPSPTAPPAPSASPEPPTPTPVPPSVTPGPTANGPAPLWLPLVLADFIRAPRIRRP